MSKKFITIDQFHVTVEYGKSCTPGERKLAAKFARHLPLHTARYLNAMATIDLMNGKLRVIISK